MCIEIIKRTSYAVIFNFNFSKCNTWRVLNTNRIVYIDVIFLIWKNQPKKVARVVSAAPVNDGEWDLELRKLIRGEAVIGCSGRGCGQQGTFPAASGKVRPLFFQKQTFLLLSMSLSCQITLALLPTWPSCNHYNKQHKWRMLLLSKSCTDQGPIHTTPVWLNYWTPP